MAQKPGFAVPLPSKPPKMGFGARENPMLFWGSLTILQTRFPDFQDFWKKWVKNGSKMGQKTGQKRGQKMGQKTGQKWVIFGGKTWFSTPVVL